ncbi:hypothetical protein Psfp_02341 [Pelotomaculum sp. FP]|uniref:hypothetical protein n=1 Tax=Pelotomaculum sp. FP TaxID=261474 RepID=UPI00110091F8|nr:hypothetical protein [Pelotomaculum sp. FP]TEB15165.1 hypothetical protein Psfp_02341 [Pelotomaculum sp. FP]
MSYLNYDITLLYKSVADTMASIWPIVAPAFAIMLAMMIIGGLGWALHKFIDDRR